MLRRLMPSTLQSPTVEVFSVACAVVCGIQQPDRWNQQFSNGFMQDYAGNLSRPDMSRFGDSHGFITIRRNIAESFSQTQLLFPCVQLAELRVYASGEYKTYRAVPNRLSI